MVKPAVPMTPESLAEFFGTKVALPKRAKGNAWASAQHIESNKHRNTVSALMTEASRGPAEAIGELADDSDDFVRDMARSRTVGGPELLKEIPR